VPPPPAVIGYDVTLLALASAFGGALVTGFFTLLGSHLNHKQEARREKERADREDQREHERSERQSHERLNDLRRVECINLIYAADRLVNTNPSPEEAARLFLDLNRADDTLQLFGPESLARASFDFAACVRRWRQLTEDPKVWPPDSPYVTARAAFYRAAKEALGYLQEACGL
jgi:hypothetical protein